MKSEKSSGNENKALKGTLDDFLLKLLEKQKDLSLKAFCLQGESLYR